MKTKLTAALLAVLCATSANAQHTSASIRPTKIIEINPAGYPTTETRGVQVRFNRFETGDLAGTQDADGSVTWNGSQREAMGGQDAPARILIRAFDGVFSIDPFVPLPEGNEDIANLLFNGVTLETNHIIFSHNRIERVEKLMKILEVARHNWLRNNGFYGVKSFTNSRSSGESRADASLPEPAASFRIPADVPRGKSNEQVNADDTNARSIASNLLNSDEPVRISLPFGTASDVVARVEARNEASHEASSEEATQELASNE
tara:strand:- start:28997 stop:29782 length:786 start_codon:yes stop_codon:yes gene_type:complete